MSSVREVGLGNMATCTMRCAYMHSDTGPNAKAYLFFRHNALVHAIMPDLPNLVGSYH